MHRAACPARTPKACHKQIKFWNLQRLFVKSTNQALNRFGCIVCSDDLNMENHTEKDFAPPFNQKQQQKEMRVLRPPNPKQERKKKDRGTLSSEDNEWAESWRDVSFYLPPLPCSSVRWRVLIGYIPSQWVGEKSAFLTHRKRSASIIWWNYRLDNQFQRPSFPSLFHHPHNFGIDQLLAWADIGDFPT